MAPRKPKGTPTRLNIRTLAQLFGELDEVPNRVEPTSVDGIKRCNRAGLVEVSEDRKSLRLTDAGREAVAEHADARARGPSVHLYGQGAQKVAPEPEPEREEPAPLPRTDFAILIDDEPAGTLHEFLEVNEYLDPEDRAAIIALRPGQSFEGGGGAAADYKITRVTARSGLTSKPKESALSTTKPKEWKERARWYAIQDARELAPEADSYPGAYERRNMRIEEYGGRGAEQLDDDMREAAEAGEEEFLYGMRRTFTEDAYHDAFVAELRRLRPELREAGDEG